MKGEVFVNFDRDVSSIEDWLISVLISSNRVRYSELDDFVATFVQDSGKWACVDEIFLFLFQEDGEKIDVSHHWIKKNVFSRVSFLKKFMSQYRKFSEHEPINGKMLCFLGDNKVKIEGCDSTRLLHLAGIRSLDVYTLCSASMFLGYFGFVGLEVSKKWTVKDQKIYACSSEALGDAIYREYGNSRQEKFLQALESTNQDLKEFAHIVSHELKRPISKIRLRLMSFCSDRTGNLDLEVDTTLNWTLEALESLNHLVNQILHYSGIAWLETAMDEVDLNKVLEKALSEINVPDTVSIVIERQFPSIWFEEFRITQVFKNLIDNAVKHMQKKNGQISVGCKFETEKERWLFWVSDNGKGIAPEIQSKIFDLFYTGSDNIESSGVGLALVKKMIEMYDGKIWVDSKPRRGSTFYFTVPV